MDGNRRFAHEHNLPTLEGHRRGLDVFLDMVQFVREANIQHAVFYAFSTENWNRSKEEVAYLMTLFSQLFTQMAAELEERQVHVRVIGRREDFSPELREKMHQLEEKSSRYTNTTIWIALSYGGRAEIIKAVNEAILNGVPVDESTFKQLLSTVDMPDPDMIVRTSGEQRLSNFLTWESVYSELYFMPKHWPALTKSDFNDILMEYGRRTRRYGS